MTPLVINVISYFSLHPGLGVMGGVKCFRVFGRPFDSVFIRHPGVLSYMGSIGM